MIMQRPGSGRGSRALLCVFAVVFGLLSVLEARAEDEGPEIQDYAEQRGGEIVGVGQLAIDGNRMICGKRPTVLDRSLDDFAAAYPGFLILNPDLMKRVPTVVQLWIYGHECAHQFIGRSEEAADCWAVQRGRRQGWLNESGIEQICAFLAPSRGSSVHAPGPERCAAMRICFAEAGGGQ